MKVIKLKVSIVDKIISYKIIIDYNRLNIMSILTMEKLGFSIIGPSFYVVNMANQSMK